MMPASKPFAPRKMMRSTGVPSGIAPNGARSTRASDVNVMGKTDEFGWALPWRGRVNLAELVRLRHEAGLSPHPEERRLRRVSKDEATVGPHGSSRRARVAAPDHEGLMSQ